MEMKFELITPERASALLSTSDGNPRWKNKLVDKRKVEMISRDIRNGEWHPANSSIGVMDGGVLKDGHHRLAAVISTGIPVWMWVCYGIPAEAEFHIDDNDKRSATQLLHRTNMEIGLANLHMKMLSGNPHYRSSIHELESILLENEDAVYFATHYKRTGGNTFGGRSFFSHSIFAAMLCGVSSVFLSRFMDVVASGFANGDEESAAICIRNQYLNKTPLGDYARIQAAKNCEQAIFDFIGGVKRRRPYNVKTAIWTDRLKEGKA